MSNKAEIARANGAKSNGPVTAEGKVISSRNSLKHGRCERNGGLGKRDNEKMILVCWELFPRVGGGNRRETRARASF